MINDLLNCSSRRRSQTPVAVVTDEADDRFIRHEDTALPVMGEEVLMENNKMVPNYSDATLKCRDDSGCPISVDCQKQMCFTYDKTKPPCLGQCSNQPQRQYMYEMPRFV